MIIMMGSDKMKKVFLLVLLTLLLSGCGKKTLECPTGTLVDGVCKVVEYSDVVFGCKDGFNFNEETKKCENIMVIDAKKVSKCPEGYEIWNNYWCYGPDEFEIVKKKECISKNISDDDKLSTTYEKDNKCFEKICTKPSEDGKTCEEFKEKQIKYTTKDTCPEKNMIIREGVCRKKAWYTSKYSCEIGELDGTKCTIKTEEEVNYSCVGGYNLTDDKKCEKVTYKEADYK